MASAEFHHFGVPTSAEHDNETYIEGAKVHVSDPESHPYRVEFLRFEQGSPLPENVQTRPHAAFIVEDLDAALEGQHVVIPPFDATDVFRCAFIADGDALIELMERR